MPVQQPLAVFFDREDVLAAAPGETSRDAVALTPSAVTAAAEAGISIRRTLMPFSGRDHARCVAAARRALRDFDRGGGMMTLPPALALTARQALWQQACLVHRLHLTLPVGPWRVRDKDGRWVVADDWPALHAALLPRIWSYGLGHRITAGRPALPGLHRMLTRLSALLAGRRRSPWVAAVTTKLRYGLREALAESGASLAVFQMTAGDNGDYRRLAADMFGGGSVFLVAPMAEDDPRVVRSLLALESLGASIGDARVRSAWQLYAGVFARIVPGMLAMATEGRRLMHLMGVRAVVSYEANAWLASALLEAAGDGIRRVVFNHNSHPKTNGAIADSVLETLFRQRTWNPLVDLAALWSPAAGTWIADDEKAAGQRRVQPVRLTYAAIPPAAGAARSFRILHAGNYQNWSDFFPWVAETAAEYLEGMEALARTVEQMDGVEVVFRVRAKREVDAATVEARLGHRRNVTVCGTEQEFLNQLGEFDLLVSHFSTTVEQAVQMGKPVLLWGSTDRYRQFPGRETPPDTTSRAAVYAVRHANDLPAMIAGIRAAHQACPLRDEEVRLYRFGPTVPGVGDLARQLSGERDRATGEAA